MKPVETCKECGGRVGTFDVVDESNQPTGEQVVLDLLPSIHGYYRRPSLAARVVVEEPIRRTGWLRPHHERCSPSKDAGA